MQLFGDAGAWFAQQPPCSRWLLLLSLAVPAGLGLGLLPIQLLHYDARLLFGRLQLWRAISSLFLAKPSIGFLFNCFFRFQYSMQLEMASGRFPERADYLYFLILITLGLNVQKSSHFLPIL